MTRQIIFCKMVHFYSEEFFTRHPTPKLEYYPLWLCAITYSIYLQLPSILEAVPPICNPTTCHAFVTGTHLSWLYCILWWIYCKKWFRWSIVSMYNKHYCFLSSWYVSFLGSSGKVTYHASNFRWKFCVLKALQLSVGLKDMYNSCLQVFGIYIYIYAC